MGGARWGPLHLMRKRLGIVFSVTVALTLFTYVLLSINISSEERAQLAEQRLVEMQLRAQYVESLHRATQEDVMALENGMSMGGAGNISRDAQLLVLGLHPPTMPPDFAALLKNLSGAESAAVAGFDARRLAPLRMPPLAYQLLPHLLTDPHSTLPLFHMRATTSRAFPDVVVGVPSVRRDMDSYLMYTLAQLVQGLSPEEEPSTLIVVLLAETDPNFVLQTAFQIEIAFPKQVESGLIEVLSPRRSFYPDLEAMQPTLGDPAKRFKWRTKQNLDSIYLMSYCRTRATFYLMLEDDVMVKKNYVKEIKKFVGKISVGNPHWLLIEFCRVGGIGKLFKSSELLSFITYVQLFYTNLPIDWLIESYLTDRVCTIQKGSKKCELSKLEVRPRYPQSLFQHIGYYSSLSGKIQKAKDTNFGTVPLFVPHDNPPLASLRTTITPYSGHTLQKAYEGTSFFWGLKPKKGDFMEFAFETPINIGRYKLVSGSAEHVSDRLYGASVEALRSNASSYVTLGHCDSIGRCEGAPPLTFGKMAALRFVLHEDSQFWLIISEIWITEEKAR